MALIDNILSYWKFDGDVTDELGTNDGTDNGTTDIAGIIGRGRDFENSEDDYVAVGTGLAFTTQSFSVNMWLKAETIINEARLFCTNDLYGWGFWLGSDGVIIFQRLGVAGATSTDKITTGSWQMFTLTYDQTANEVRFYFNGNLDSGGAISFSHEFDAGKSYSIGNGFSLPNFGWDGVIDEVGVWENKVLSQAEVTELYNSGAGLSYPFAVVTNMKINIADTFKDVDSMQINIGDVWKDVVEVQQNIGDVWKNVY